MGDRKRRVVWAGDAVQDLIEIVAYIAGRSPQEAQHMEHRLRSRAESLGHSPARCRYVPELLFAGSRAWRELVIKPYRIVYRVHEKDVLVGAILDGRRDLQDLLLERLTRYP